MRRSKAPSVLNKAKRICQTNDQMNESTIEQSNSDPEDDQYEWGSRNNNGEIKQNTLKNKRVFNIVWRDVTTKKHKTWKGDGTLEVNTFTTKAILKDETGKYIGCSSKFNMNDLVVDFQMVIGGKEIEIQNEIVDEDELHDVRKRQVLNRNWGEEEWIDPKDLAEEEKKPKGGFKFKPILVLKAPAAPSNVKVDFECEKRYEYPKPSTSSNCELNKNSYSQSQMYSKPNTTSFLINNKFREYICFIQPSELQQFIFQKALEFYSSIKHSLTEENIKSFDIDHVLQLICNHPSFINYKSTKNELIQYLLPCLPDWSEMGPFDSGKLEFVQYFLIQLSQQKSEKCIILAKNPNSLNMLQGLCDFMNINCLRLNNNSEEDFKNHINNICSEEHSENQVLLVNSIKIFKDFKFPTNCIKLIVFEETSENMLKMEKEVKVMNIYYLITAFSIEELLLLDIYKNNLLEILDELLNMSDMDNECCYIHSKIECNCFEGTQESTSSRNIFLKDWRHLKTPYDEEFLERSSLVNCAENIVTIFCKNLY